MMNMFEMIFSSTHSIEISLLVFCYCIHRVLVIYQQGSDNTQLIAILFVENIQIVSFGIIASANINRYLGIKSVDSQSKDFLNQS